MAYFVAAPKRLLLELNPMPGPKPPEIKLTPLLMQILEKISRRYTNPYWLVVRAKMVLFAQAGDNNSEIARRLDTDADTVAHWRARWLTATPRLSMAESEHMPERDLCSLIVATLADDFRPGMPNTITPEQIIQMVAVACEDPKRVFLKSVVNWRAWKNTPVKLTRPI